MGHLPTTTMRAVATPGFRQTTKRVLIAGFDVRTVVRPKPASRLNRHHHG
jgi:hypothetical protein